MQAKKVFVWTGVWVPAVATGHGTDKPSLVKVYASPPLQPPQRSSQLLSSYGLSLAELAASAVELHGAPLQPVTGMHRLFVYLAMLESFMWLGISWAPIWWKLYCATLQNEYYVYEFGTFPTGEGTILTSVFVHV